MPACPNCNNQVGEGAVFCDQCGTRMPAPEAATPAPTPGPTGGSVICPACGAGNMPGEAFCDFCGSPLEAPVPTVDEVPEPEVVAEPEAKGAQEAPPPEEKATCQACGAKVLSDEAFCANCGASLAQPPIPPEPVPEAEPEPVLEEVPPEPAPEVAPEPVLEEAPSEPAPEVAPEPVVEEAPPEPVVETPPPPPAPAPPVVPTCPACGAEVVEDDKFCSNCGAVLAAEAVPAPVEAPPAPAPPPPPAGPRLVVAASGAEIPLPAGGEVLIGRQDPVSGIYPDVDLTPHEGEEGGVSRRHARLILEGGNYFVEDLDSTNFTFVNQQKLAPKPRHQINDGDEIRCGRVALVLKT